MRMILKILHNLLLVSPTRTKRWDEETDTSMAGYIRDSVTGGVIWNFGFLEAARLLASSQIPPFEVSTPPKRAVKRKAPPMEKPPVAVKK
uniref:Transposase n=1 Tax=Caenorhabditis tropicalis TaxID=1561998 RepID=A0A1I7UV66_9PELO